MADFDFFRKLLKLANKKNTGQDAISYFLSAANRVNVSIFRLFRNFSIATQSILKRFGSGHSTASFPVVQMLHILLLDLKKLCPIGPTVRWLHQQELLVPY